MSLRKPALDVVEYPETDGEPFAETDTHAQLMIDLRFSLSEFFREDSGVYVSGNLLLYYVEGDPANGWRRTSSSCAALPKGFAASTSFGKKGGLPDIVFEV